MRDMAMRDNITAIEIVGYENARKSEYGKPRT